MNEEKNSYEDEGYFKFPFKPYSIQEDFMKKLYYTLDNDKIGIFESPTGTGKSLSLICGALTWLRDYEKRNEDEIKAILTGTDTGNKDEGGPKENKEVDWVEEFYQEKAAKDMLAKVKEKEESKNKQRNKLNSLRKESKLKKRKREDLPSVGSPLENDLDEENGEKKKEVEEDEDKDLVLADYTSDNESATKSRGTDESSGEEEETAEEDEGLKIFYCSRTHSQLTQFVHEVQKSPFADWIKLVALASRQSYCINENVKHLKSVNKINEKCLDMQKKKKEKKEKKNEDTEKPIKKRRKKNEVSGCPYYSYARFQEFQNHATVDVQDIEQLISLGKDLDTCPYYGSRHSIPKAQLVVLPYQTLLHKSTRASVGVKLKGNVVIIDEAHNLIETINSIHSNEVSLAQILLSISQLGQYRDKYKNRLKAKNLMYINQIIYVLNALKDVLKVVSKIDNDKENAFEKEKVESLMLTINDFLLNTKLDNINLFKIRKYCEKSMIAQKLNGFVDKYHGFVGNQNQAHHSGNDSSPTTSQFLYIESFLDALTNCDKDGRILVTKTGLASKSSIKFLLLNPAVHFIDVVKECKAVVVAGGTMQPISEFKDVLLYSAQVTADRITEFSCGHVIPPENLTAVCIGKGPMQIDMNFTYQNRDNPQLIDELSRVLCNICTIVPGGVVCFFPSYDYEEFVYSRWKKIGAIEKIEKRKKIFREPKKTGGCENVLSQYTKTINSSFGTFGTHGALLLSVVGGKMSEGINFSDQLGRCIVMVGLPYPNKNSPELKEKMEFLNKNIGPNAGQEHYENICMKAVNQSIGRAIRHKGDYATILLLDQRYARNSVQGKLPTWIRSQLQIHQRFGPGFSSISRFFSAKRNEAEAMSF